VVGHAARGAFVTVVFCVALAHGWWTARLSSRAALVFAALFVGGFIGFPYLGLTPYAFIAWIAVLDVALVLMAYGRDFGLGPTWKD
jgi:hypothetical protein